jgi:hypothetical protein
MIRFVFVLVLLAFSLGASSLTVDKWGNGETFLNFLEKNNLPLNIYYDLDIEEQELATEIMSNVKYQILKYDNNTI